MSIKEGCCQFNVVIIGAGNIAAFFDEPNSLKVLTHAHAFVSHPSFRLQGFYDIDMNKAEMAAERWNSEVFDSLDDAMHNADIVCCCVPDRFHYEVLNEMIKYDVKLVIAEKPLVAEYKDVARIKNAYLSKRIPVLLNYSRRFIPEMQLLKNEVGVLGKYLKGVGYYGKGLLHNGSHMIDFIRFLFDDMLIIEHVGDVLTDCFENDPCVDFSVRVAGGIIDFRAIDCRRVTIFELDLLFECGRIQMLDGGKLIRIYKVRESDEYKEYSNYALEKEWYVDYSGAMKGMVSNAEEYLLGRKELLCSLEDGIQALEICKKVKEQVF